MSDIFDKEYIDGLQEKHGVDRIQSPYDENVCLEPLFVRCSMGLSEHFELE